jgi:hypothetical protein
MSLPERSDEHVIDQMACNYFESAIPPEWARNPFQPRADYGKDYQVEPFVNGQPVALEVYFQVKGTRSPIRRKKHISFPLEIKHVEYYVHSLQLPIFLAVIDVTKKEGYYCFLQGYIKEHLMGASTKKWRSQKTVTIRVPLTNRLENSRQLLSDFEAAKAFLKPNVKELLEWAIKTIDPRFKIKKMEISDAGTHTTFEAIAPVSIQLTLTGISKKTLEAYQRGLEIDVQPDNYKFEGSPLFNFNKAAKIQVGYNERASVSLIATDASGVEVVLLQGIKGVIEGGQTERRFIGALEGSPLKVNILQNQTLGSLKLGLALESWSGQKISRLLHFNEVVAFVDALVKGCDFTVEGFLPTPTKVGKVPMQEKFADWKRLLAMFSMARAVASYFGIHPMFPKKIDLEQISEIEKLHSLISKGSVSYPRSNQRVTMHLSGIIPSEFLSKPPKERAPLRLAGNLPFNVFDTKIFLRNAISTISDVEFVRVYKEDKKNGYAMEFNSESTSYEVLQWDNISKKFGLNDDEDD